MCPSRQQFTSVDRPRFTYRRPPCQLRCKEPPPCIVSAAHVWYVCWGPQDSRPQPRRKQLRLFKAKGHKAEPPKGKAHGPRSRGRWPPASGDPVPAGPTGRAWLPTTGRHSPAEPLSAANLVQTQRPCLQSGMLTQGTWAWTTIQGYQEAGVQRDPHAPKDEA